LFSAPAGFAGEPSRSGATSLPAGELAQKDDGDDLLLPGKKARPAPPKKEAADDDDLLLPGKKAQPEPAGKEAAEDDLLLPGKKQTAEDDALLPGKKGAAAPAPAAAEAPLGLKGYLRGEAAYTFRDPEHWSKARGVLEIGSNGKLGEWGDWKVTGRAYYDAVFGIEDNFYPPAVENDQRHEFQWRETYLDFDAAGLDFRLGRQQIVWGEMVALFFADVVSARDVREFILPEFETLRIPQWAARAEYFDGDFHAEVVWIPYVTVDNIGKPGAEFYSYPPPATGIPGYAVADVEEPDHKVSNSNFGLRFNNLKDGWDYSGFYYHSVDVQPTYYRTIIPAPPAAVPTALFTPRHEKIDQVGGTIAKEFADFVFKGEAVFTHGRQWNVTRASEDDGVVPSNTIDWILGAEMTPFRDGRLNLQLFQRYFTSHDSDMIPDRAEWGGSILLNSKLGRAFELEGLLISSLNRRDWLFRPKLTWNLERNWRWVFGIDVFDGPADGFFGQFDAKDRVYTELRRSF
jgi:hypothetical protein